MEIRIIDALRRAGKPMSADMLMMEFEDKDSAAVALQRLLAEGRLLLTRKRKLALPEQAGLVYGRVQAHARGFGFFIPEDGSSDLFLPADAMHGAMHGDKVWARVTDQVSKNGTPEAEIVLIAVRAHQRIVGTFDSENHAGGFVVPDETRIPMDMFIKDTDMHGAKPGDKVVAEIVQYPDGRRPITGKITEVLGRKDQAGTDILSIVRRFDLPEKFSKGALRLAKAVKEPGEDIIAQREDLRGWTVITIDGADAKDLDDAISLKRLSDGNYLLGVHIADVSSYVAEGSALDKDAYERGTSVYLLDRVLPMLPQELSNGVCSLNEKQNKLTLSCIMQVDKSGKIVDHRIAETVINSCRRMVYDEVNSMLEGDKELCDKYADVLPMLLEMKELMKILNSKRMKRGSIDFDLDEARITLDETGQPVDVARAERGASHRIIEEFMLAANETVAQHLYKLCKPCMYRVHEKPDREKLSELNVFLQTLGYGLRGVNDVQPRTFQKILLAAKGTKEEVIVNRVTLRSMKKARYCEANLGHFGLAAEHYCHFTSPIRRYPDLVVHRLLKELIHGSLDDRRAAEWNELLPKMAAHCSDREKVAQEAERAVDELKKCEYMSKRIGDEFNALISGVAQFGFFAALDNTVEGMVRIASLDDDYYVCDEKNYRLVGRRTGRVFRLGDEVRVKVVGTDTESLNVDFELVKEKGGESFIVGRKRIEKPNNKSQKAAGKKQGRSVHKAAKGRGY
ncbi:MAG: Ribonuclease R [Firmicutes bacterium ADurb.Bin182]|nr:MAG: Ribonuclease R [Firmicutes bacterium ADurb.Bin182]